MSGTYERALMKAKATPGYDPSWASSAVHARDRWPAENRRRRCTCGCKGAASWVGGCNGIPLMSGCELKVSRWVRDGYAAVTP